MTPELGHQEHLQNPPERTIAVVKFGNSHYLLNENDAASVSFRFIDPVAKSLDYIKATRHLPSSSVTEFPDVNDARLTISQLVDQQPTIKFRQRTSGFDEPTLTFVGRDGKKAQNVPVSVDLHEEELFDLFLRKPGKEHAASFTVLDTSEHEIVAVAIKREFPVLMAMTQGRDGNTFSANAGLLQFVDSVYQRLFENKTPFQNEIDDQIFKATAPGGPISFKLDASTPSRQRQRDIQKRIYQIQGLLLAMKAEAGQGMDDPELKAHVPFLKNSNASRQNGSDLLNRFSRFLETPAGHNGQSANAVVIDNGIWDSLVQTPDSSLLVDPRGRVLSGVQHTPRPQPQPAPRPQPVVRPAPEPVRQPAPVTRPATPVRQPGPLRQSPQPRVEVTPPQPTEKQQAEQLADSIQREIANASAFLHTLSIDNLRITDVFKFNRELEKSVEAAKAHMEKRKNGTPVANPIEVTISPEDGAISVGGVTNANVLSYLTGPQEASYKDKITAALRTWDSHVKPFYTDIKDGQDRTIGSLIRGGKMKEVHPHEAKMIAAQLNTLLRKHDPSMAIDSINAAELSHFLLSSQILHALSEQYSELKLHGQAAEIDKWAAFSYLMLNRLKQLVPNATAPKSA